MVQYVHAVLEPNPAFQQLSHVGLQHTTGIMFENNEPSYQPNNSNKALP